MNKKSIWKFLDSQTTKEVNNYIDTHEDYIKSKQNDIDNLACHFCKRNKKEFFEYLIEKEICDSPTMKENCEPDNCNFFCSTLVIDGMTAKQIEEEEKLKFIKEIEQIMEEHKDEFDKLS